MNKVEYTKTTLYTVFNKVIFKKIEIYNERYKEDISDDTPPITITEDYKKAEFNI